MPGDLRILSDLDDGQVVKHFRYAIEGKPTNGWIVKQDSGQIAQPVYSYFNGRCQFSMMKSGAGNTPEINHYSGDEKVNSSVAEVAIKLIPVPALI